MAGMNGDMSDVWESLARDLRIYLEDVNNPVIEAFDNAFEIAMSTGVDEPSAANNRRSGMRALAATLVARKDLMVHGIENSTESFESELSSLKTNALSSIRTAFLGRLMETTYHGANMEYGKCLFPTQVITCTDTILRRWQRPPPQGLNYGQIWLPFSFQRPPP
jgi:hypothetical protein